MRVKKGCSFYKIYSGYLWNDIFYYHLSMSNSFSFENVWRSFRLLDNKSRDIESNCHIPEHHCIPYYIAHYANWQWCSMFGISGHVYYVGHILNITKWYYDGDISFEIKYLYKNVKWYITSFFTWFLPILVEKSMVHPPNVFSSFMFPVIYSVSYSLSDLSIGLYVIEGIPGRDLI